MAREFHVSELIIGLTIVAAGTSLPELATSVVAAIRGEPDMVVASLFCLPVFYTGHRVNRWEGIAFLVSYVAYTVTLIMLGR